MIYKESPKQRKFLEQERVNEKKDMRLAGYRYAREEVNRLKKLYGQASKA